SAIRTRRGTRTDWLRSERATPGHMPLRAAPVQYFFVGGVSTPSDSSGARPGPVDAAGRGEHCYIRLRVLELGRACHGPRRSTQLKPSTVRWSCSGGTATPRPDWTVWSAAPAPAGTGC